MKLDQKTSNNVVDRRGAAETHGFAAVLGMILGWCGQATVAPGHGDEDLVLLVSNALDRGQAFWQERAGAAWHDARVVLFSGSEQTPCNTASAKTGPFYCPANGRIYLDLSFLRAIDGDLARAYVIAHELGHHVAHVMRYQASGVAAELLADCLAGDWMRSELEAGHIQSVELDAALAEAEAVGDDRICPACRQEQWKHGSSDQRRAAVLRGFNAEGCAP